MQMVRKTLNQSLTALVDKKAKMQGKIGSIKKQLINS